MDKPYLLLLVQMKGKEIQTVWPVKEIGVGYDQSLAFVIEDRDENRYYIPCKRVRLDPGWYGEPHGIQEPSEP